MGIFLQDIIYLVHGVSLCLLQMAGHEGCPLCKTCATDIDYAAMVTGKTSLSKQTNEGGQSKHWRKTSTPKKVTKVKVKVHKSKDSKNLKSAFLNSTNSWWSVTPSHKGGITHDQSETVDNEEHEAHGMVNSPEISSVVPEDGEIIDIDLHEAEDNEFADEAGKEEATSLRAEIAEMKKQLENKKLNELHKQREQLHWELEAESEDSGEKVDHRQGVTSNSKNGKAVIEVNIDRWLVMIITGKG